MRTADGSAPALPTFAEKEEATGHGLARPWRILVAILAFSLGFFHLYTSGFGLLPNIMQCAVQVGLALVLTFALYPVRGGQRGRGIPIPDLVLMALSLAIGIYVVLGYDRIVTSATNSTALDRFCSVVLVLMVLEAARRTIGMAFPVLVGISLLYTFFGGYLPGVWAHRGFSFVHVAEHLFMSTNGIWGEITQVSATVIGIFVLLGSVLLRCGGGQTFIDLSVFLAGRLVGGAAKVAVVASSLMATINGNGPANVATTGSLTIPMMKRLGYKREMAAAVEAVAGTGGQIAPPVMGAGAFVMAELVGIPYAKVALAAALPALLYYVGCWFTVDFMVRREGLKPMDSKDIPNVRGVLTWRRCGPLFVPVGLLLWAMYGGYALPMAAFLAVVSALAIYLVSGGPVAEVALRARHCLQAITDGGRGVVAIASLTAAAQIVVSLINITGLAPKLSSFVVAASGGSVVLALVMTMIVALILGMGMPTVAAYILTTTVAGTVLLQVGIDKLTAHMFIFYFAVISAITPPVCTSVYVAAALAGSQWLRTALIAMGIGLSGFLVPYAFVSSSALLLRGTAVDILLTLAAACLGVIAVSAAVAGYFVRVTSLWLRVLLFVSGVLLIDPRWVTSLVGLVLLGLSWTLQMFQRRQGGRALGRYPAHTSVGSATGNE